ncbi:MAG: hypothetical protein RLZZ15_874, partial [Verrucomicrobiota bacterium]
MAKRHPTGFVCRVAPDRTFGFTQSKMTNTRLPSALFALSAFQFFLAAPAAHAAAPASSVTFKKITLTDQYLCDGINAADIDRDGHVDIVAGPYWYAGPDFKVKHEFYPMVPQPVEEKPTNSMFTF